MEVFAVNFADTLVDTFTKLGAGLIHGQQNTGNLQLWVEFSLDCMNHVQNFRNTLTGKEMSLDRDDAVI